MLKGCVIMQSIDCLVVSAVRYHFAREVHQEENVPIGVIESSCSWTPAESWLSREALAADPELKRDILKRWDDIEANYARTDGSMPRSARLWEKAETDSGGDHAVPSSQSRPLDPASIHRASGHGVAQ